MQREGGAVVSEETGLAYVLVMVQDVSGFVWLEPVQCATAAEAETVAALVKGCIIFGHLLVWVGDTAIHFNDGLMTFLAEMLMSRAVLASNVRTDNHEQAKKNSTIEPRFRKE